MPPATGAGRARLPRHADAPPTPSPPCSRTARWPSRGWTPGWSTSSAGAGRRPVPDAAARRRLADGRGRRATTSARPRGRAERLAADAGALRPSAASPTGPERRRCGGSARTAPGLAGRTPDGRQAWPGWEDAAVPPANLGALPARLRGADAPTTGSTGLPYGHFGDGCIHVRIDLPLDTTARGASARSSLEPAELVAAARRVAVRRARRRPGAQRAAADHVLRRGARRCSPPSRHSSTPRPAQPRGAGRPATARRRPAPAAGADRCRADGGFAFAHDDGDFTKAVHRCVGVGKCRADNRAAGGFMCPSYLATRDEKDATRGRARVLQETGQRRAGRAAWSSPEVHESLDLCLSCKACASDCPAGVDMARYKSEVLHRTLPRQAAAASPLQRSAGCRAGLRLVDAVPGSARCWSTRCSASGRRPGSLLRAAGIDPRRRAPRFAPHDVPPLVAHGTPAGSAADAATPVVCCGSTPSPTASARGRPGRRRGPGGRRLRVRSPTGRPAAG